MTYYSNQTPPQLFITFMTTLIQLVLIYLFCSIFERLQSDKIDDRLKSAKPTTPSKPALKGNHYD